MRYVNKNQATADRINAMDLLPSARAALADVPIDLYEELFHDDHSAVEVEATLALYFWEVTE